MKNGLFFSKHRRAYQPRVIRVNELKNAQNKIFKRIFLAIFKENPNTFPVDFLLYFCDFQSLNILNRCFRLHRANLNDIYKKLFVINCFIEQKKIFFLKKDKLPGRPFNWKKCGKNWVFTHKLSMNSARKHFVKAF